MKNSKKGHPNLEGRLQFPKFLPNEHPTFHPAQGIAELLYARSYGEHVCIGYTHQKIAWSIAELAKILEAAVNANVLK